MDSRLIIIGQFLLIGLIAWPSAPFQTSLLALLLAGAGCILGAVTLMYNRIGNFNIRPELKENTELVVQGPYRWIRHPMYLTVLLLCGSLLAAYGQTYKYPCFLGLFALLGQKIAMEERFLAERFPEYSSYREGTWKVFPWVW